MIPGINGWCFPLQSLDLKEQLVLQVKQLTLDCDMFKEKSSVIQGQMRELQDERDQVRAAAPLQWPPQ